MTTLIFPSSTDEALSFYRQKRSQGAKIICASSVAYDETASWYEEWFHLPTIHDNDFVSQLKRAIKLHGIEEIFCPHHLVFPILRDLIDNKTIDVKLVSVSPWDMLMDRYRTLFDRATIGLECIHTLSNGHSQLSTNDVSAILRLAETIPGALNESKLFGLLAIASSVPQGDIVEVGVSWGKSAFILHYLAQYYEIGSMLAIDPWDTDHVVQYDFPEHVQNLARAMDQNQWDLRFRSFCIHLLPFANKSFNYLRQPSSTGYQSYTSQLKVTSHEFGTVNYSGNIALMHIDGNHDYNMVLEDYQLWFPLIRPGGWLVLDDYYLLHSDGPKKVGDMILDKHHKNIATSFVCGKALFVQLKSGVSQ